MSLPYRKRTRGAVLTVTQGSLIGAGKTLKVFVEIKGRGVGTLTYDSRRRSVPRFTAKNGQRFDWGGNSKDSERLKLYLEQEAKAQRVPERDAQGALVRAMFASPKHPLLARLQPVRPAGCMMEIPAAVKASDGLAPGGGSVDVLVRAVGGRAARFIVCEVKRPGLDADPYKVLLQAIRYAAAIDLEVNGCAPDLEPADAALYRELFGATGSARLRFGAMAAIHADGARIKETASAVDAAIRQLAPAKSEWLDAFIYTERGGGYEPVWRWRSA